MALATTIITILNDNKSNIAKAAIYTGSLVTTNAITYAISKKESEAIIQEEKKKSYKHGLEDGKQITIEKMKQTLIDPILTRIAIIYFIARIDGKISKHEQIILDQKISIILDNPEIPTAVKKEAKNIASNKNIDLSFVINYLEKISDHALQMILSDIYEVAEATDGISEIEQDAINELSNYVINRTLNYEISTNDINYTIEDYLDSLVPLSVIEQKTEEYSLKMKMLDYAFSKKTKLNAAEHGLLMMAVALQCFRIYFVNYITTIEKAGNKNIKENTLHKFQDKILSNFSKPSNEVSTEYFAPLSQIITGRGVPYDTTSYKDENLKLFKGANHRFATLGHDPLIGLVIGTTNIMTNTITTIGDVNPIPHTYHVTYDNLLKNPKIANEASLVIAMKKAIDRTKTDKAPLAAALIKQLIHIATDIYTTAGIQLPGANLVLSNTNVEQLTKYINTGDIVKATSSASIDIFINDLISLLHGCMLLNTHDDLSNKLNQAKTKKIILLSNSIATHSNLIKNTITCQYDKIDWGGLLVLLNRMFSDIHFIYDVKREFISFGLNEY